MESVLSVLLAFWHSLLTFFRALAKNIFTPTDYGIKLYYPIEPAYFQAKKRDPETIITRGLTKDVLAKHSKGFDGVEGQLPTIVDEKVKTGGEEEATRPTETVSVRTFLEARCPSLLGEYRPTWWLANGHLNTCYCILGDFTKKDIIDYDRTTLLLPDGGTIGVDFTPPATQRTLDPKTPIILVVHGLSGGSYESYVRDVLSTACATKEDGGLGYRGVVMNFRGCAGMELTTSQLYSGWHTDDLRATILYLRTLYPDAPLLGVGFSLGANIVTLYAEQEGDKCCFRSGASLGCPWDFVANAKQLHGRWFYRHTYAKALGGNLLYLLRSHLKTITALPPTPATPFIKKLLGMHAPTLKDFDNHVTRFMGGPTKENGGPFPLDTADEYYEIASSHRDVHNIKVPFLAFNTLDDPVVAEIPLEDVGRSECVAQVVTAKGGHLGWFEGSSWRIGGFPIFGGPPARWVRKPVLEWLQATGEDLGTEMDYKGLKGVLGKDGFVRQEGREEIGWKVVSEGVRVVPPEGVKAQVAAGGS